MFKLLKINEARKTINKLEDDVLAVNEQLSQAQSELESSKEFNSDLQGIVAEKELEVVEAHLELKDATEKIEKLEANALDATAAAADIVASIGAEKPVEIETQEEKSNAELMDEFTTLTDPAKKVDFYRKHRTKLLNKE